MASGKNVDIDFELMIEKNKFKEKLISPHVSSADVKVILKIFSLLYASEKDPSLKNKSKTDK